MTITAIRTANMAAFSELIFLQENWYLSNHSREYVDFKCITKLMTDSCARTVILLLWIGMEIFMVVSVTAFLSKPHLSQWNVLTQNACQSCAWQDVPVKCWSHLYHAWLNHWRCGSNFKSITVKPIENSILGTGHGTAFSWWLQNLNDEKSTLVQVIAWCCQTIRYYLSQCWPRSASIYCIARPLWVDNSTYQCKRKKGQSVKWHAITHDCQDDCLYSYKK